jgi:hypothetical protein
MKLLFFVHIFILLVIGKNLAQEMPHQKANDDINQILLGLELSDYGYQKQSPFALIEAARLLMNSNFRNGDSSFLFQKVQQKPLIISDKQFQISTEKLLADAQNMLVDDETQSKLVDELIKEISRGLYTTREKDKKSQFIVYQLFLTNKQQKSIEVYLEKGFDFSFTLQGDKWLSDFSFYLKNAKGKVVASHENCRECKLTYKPQENQTLVLVVANNTDLSFKGEKLLITWKK